MYIVRIRQKNVLKGTWHSDHWFFLLNYCASSSATCTLQYVYEIFGNRLVDFSIFCTLKSKQCFTDCNSPIFSGSCTL